MFNKSQIMRRAWEIYRTDYRAAGRNAFRAAMRDAWWEAKYDAQMAAQAAQQSDKVQQLRSNIVVLESKGHWTRDDYARHDALTAQLREAA